MSGRAQILAKSIARELGPEGPKNLAQALVANIKPEDIRDLVEELTHALVAVLGISADIYTEDIRKLLKLLSEKSSVQESEPTLLNVMNPSHYQALREALAHNTFAPVEGSPWPTANLSKGTAKGLAELRPPCIDEQAFISPEEQETWSQMMWRQREELSDLDVDILDGLSAIWLQTARNSQDDALTGIDDLIAMRSLKPKRNGDGRDCGFRPEQRADVIRSLCHIQNLWLHMAELDVYPENNRRSRPTKQLVQSRAFVVTDRLGQLRLDGCLDVQRIIFRPGKVFAIYLFGPGRQTALLSAKALQYDPYRQDWEKRLTRYFSWQWKCQARKGREATAYRVKTLTDAVGVTPQASRPIRTRERLEKALDVLLRDGVIAGWQYERWDELTGQKRGWLDDWLNTTVLVESPESIKEHYRRLDKSLAKVTITPATMLDEPSSLLRKARLAKSWTQLQAAEYFGISQPYLSLLERGKIPLTQVSPSLRGKLDVLMSLIK